MFLFSRWERAVCRVKAIVSSVELYANCSGSSEAGSTEQMWSLMSFSKHLLKMGVRAMGLQSFKHGDFIFLRYGHNGGFFEEWGKHRQREGKIENVYKNPGFQFLPISRQEQNGRVIRFAKRWTGERFVGVLEGRSSSGPVHDHHACWWWCVGSILELLFWSPP